MDNKPPKIEGAPGLIWRPRKVGWECRWQARTDLVLKGFLPKSARLWSGTEDRLNETVVNWIRDCANALQNQMLLWGHGGVNQAAPFSGTWASLIENYQSDQDSNYKKLRHRTRVFYDTLMRRLKKDIGNDLLADTKSRNILRLHEQWGEGGKVTMSHSLIGHLRILVNFGATILEDPECERIAGLLHRMRFKMSRPRSERLTAPLVIAVRAKARETNQHSMALAQALQFELILRQKDVIGEWVPTTEPGISDVLQGNDKWLRGLRWEEIDVNLTVRHMTSKREKMLEVSLLGAPMVVEELQALFPGCITEETTVVAGKEVTRLVPHRHLLPASGAVVVREHTQAPWTDHEFRRRWRLLATACGIPKTVRNMDSRAGAISEALMAGAPLDSVRKSAKHSHSAQTENYSRGDSEATAEVAQFRVADRNKRRT